jgi:hypothetical protein
MFVIRDNLSWLAVSSLLLPISVEVNVALFRMVLLSRKLVVLRSVRSS